MIVGILKEPQGENRDALLPETVSLMIQSKINVLVESGAGTNSFAGDDNYTEAGASIHTRDEVISGSDIIAAINAPEKADLEKMKAGQLLVGLLNPFMNPDLVNDLKERNITAFSLDAIPRSTRAQKMDVLSSQATVAGYKAVLDAAGRFSRFMPMLMTAAGTIRPAKVLIIGAGVAGLQAIATARRLGAVVEAFDVRSAVREEVKSLGAGFVEVEGAQEDKAAKGYAIEQTEEFKEKQRQVVHDHAVKADIIICTAQIPGRKAPLILLKKTVESMKEGSVVIDIAASTGGNCELTRNGEVVVHNNVTIVGNSGFASEMPVDASSMFGKNLMNFLKLFITDEGDLDLNFEDDIIQGSCITHNKEIMHQRVREALKL